LKNSDGDVVIPAIYRQLTPGRKSDGVNPLPELSPFLNALTETGWGLVDLNGAIVLPFTSSRQIEQFRINDNVADYRFAVIADTTAKVVNIRNETIVDDLPLIVRIFGTRYINASRMDITHATGKLLDLDGNVVLDLGTTNRIITSANDKFAAVEEIEIVEVLPQVFGAIAKAFGVVEIATGKEVVPLTPDILDIVVLRNNLLMFSLNIEPRFQHYGLMDIHQNIIVPAAYRPDDIWFINELLESEDLSVFANFTSPTRVHWFDDGTVMPGTIDSPYQSAWFCLHFHGATENSEGMTWGTHHLYFGEHRAKLIERYVSQRPIT